MTMKKLMIVLLITVMGISVTHAQVNISEAKAKFIYNFTKFFDWPQSKQNGQFIIGVYKEDKVFYQLEDFTKGKTVNMQQISVKRFRKADQVTDCHILFVSKYGINDLPAIDNKMGSKTLLISDSDQGIDQGAILNFILSGNRLSYEFAPSHATDKGLKFSSRIRDMAAKNY